LGKNGFVVVVFFANEKIGPLVVALLGGAEVVGAWYPDVVARQDGADVARYDGAEVTLEGDGEGEGDDFLELPMVHFGDRRRRPVPVSHSRVLAECEVTFYTSHVLPFVGKTSGAIAK